ncbi:MAG: cytochrome P450 [Dehalococcoidia bacterium]|nr:cytochrome P450 [Dehalococcoidia bacterium]
MSAPSQVPPHLDLLNLDLFSREEAHEAFRELRNSDPVHWNPGNEEFRGFWSLLKYEDIMWVSREPNRFISSKGIAGSGLRNPEKYGDTEPTQTSASIITMDPPRHVKMRRLVNKGFTPRAVNRMEPQIRQIANDILDEVADRRSCDFVLEISSQLPLAVICGLMGIDKKDWPLMFDLTNKALGAGDPEYQTDVAEDEKGTIQAARKTARESRYRMGAYFKEALERRRQEPADDLITTLLESEVDGEMLDEEDILAFCFLLIVAGNETTRNAISGGMIALAQNPDQRELMLKDPSVYDTATDEIIRWVSPLHHMARQVTEDTEIRGRTIKAGERVLMWYPSANRDEDIFEDPYTFDVRRDPNEHLAFGIGEHFCLGAGFARKEVKVMFEELFRRFPDMEVDGPAERLRSNFINGVKHLPVTFSPER